MYAIRASLYKTCVQLSRFWKQAIKKHIQMFFLSCLISVKPETATNVQNAVTFVLVKLALTLKWAICRKGVFYCYT